MGFKDWVFLGLCLVVLMSNKLQPSPINGRCTPEVSVPALVEGINFEMFEDCEKKNNLFLS